MSNAKSKADVLGEVIKPKVIGDYLPDMDAMKKPFTMKDSVVRTFCSGCGTCLEIMETGARNLLVLAGVTSMTNFNNLYFQSENCPNCDSDYKKVSLKNF